MCQSKYGILAFDFLFWITSNTKNQWKIREGGLEVTFVKMFPHFGRM